MAVPAPPMSRATSSQHPATTASATADGAVAGGDALPGDDDAPVLLRRHPGFVRPKYPCMATHQRAVPCPTTATKRAEFRHVRDAFHDATRAAVC
eukprot:jgi/Tetstr1/433509/TSEL_022779.t1